jgi:Tol biopolymer transport system component
MALQDLPGSKGLWTSRWSPDGRSIAALTIDREQRLMLFDVASRVWRRTNATHVNDPTWSRDGDFVYYDTESTPHELRRYRVATGTVEHVSDFTGTLTLAWSGLAADDSPLVLRNLEGARLYAVDLRLPGLRRLS